MSTETITTGHVNETGRAALTDWLSGTLKDGDAFADQYARELIANLDGSFAEAQGLSVEVRSLHTKSGQPETYNFGPGEFDLVTTDEMGNEIARATA